MMKLKIPIPSLLVMLLFVIGYSFAEMSLDDDNVPKFLMDVYNCWNSLRDSDPSLIPNRASCLPVKTEKDLNHVDSVALMKGIGFTDTSEGFYTHTPSLTPLPPSLSFAFQTQNWSPSGEILYVNIMMSKLSISQNAVRLIREECKGPLSLHLFSKVSSNESVYSLLSSSRLKSSEFGQSMDVAFPVITQQYREWQESKEEIEMRLIIGGDNSCYRSFTPQDFGFKPNNTAYIVTYTKSLDSGKDLIITGMNALEGEAAESMRRRRNTEMNETNGQMNVTKSENDSPCQLYPFTVDIAGYGISNGDRVLFRIILPLTIEANYCAGLCNRNSFRSEILSRQVARENLTTVSLPPPCCVPNEYAPVEALLRDFQSNILIIAVLNNVQALSCGCH